MFFKITPSPCFQCKFFQKYNDALSQNRHEGKRKQHLSPLGLALNYNSCFYRLFSALIPDYLMNLLSNVYTLPSLGKRFKFMEFSLMENAFISQIFTMPPPTRKREITHPTRHHFSKNLFPPPQEGRKGKLFTMYCGLISEVTCFFQCCEDLSCFI